MRVQSLVRELRSHSLWHGHKKKKKISLQMARDWKLCIQGGNAGDRRVSQLLLFSRSITPDSLRRYGL